MKILEAQNAVLTNYEVQQHLAAQRVRYDNEAAQGKRKVPEYLRTLTNQLLTYFSTSPNPLSQQPATYDAECITELVKRLGPYGLTKGEMVVILNMRPVNGACFNACVEEVEKRFSAEQRDEMLDIVVEVLGRFPVAEGEDAEMEQDTAA